MANVVYSMSGEGRGHATRARAVVEAMRGRHQLTLFASDCAYEMLSALYEDTEVSVLRVPGLRFAYNGPGRVNLLGTVALATQLRFRMKRHVTAALRELDRIKPDLIIADFEPILPRAARVAGVPFVSFDHQHYLVVSDLSDLPFWLRRLAVNQTIVDAESASHYTQLRDILRPLGVRHQVVVAYEASATYSLKREVDEAPRAPGGFSTFGDIAVDQLATLFDEIERDLGDLPFPERVAKRYYLDGIRGRLLDHRASPNPPCVALGAHLRLYPNGDVPTCQFNSARVGNLTEQSFDEIWSGATAEKQRRWVSNCPGCWAECEVLPNALYSGDLLRALRPRTR